MAFVLITIYVQVDQAGRGGHVSIRDGTVILEKTTSPEMLENFCFSFIYLTIWWKKTSSLGSPTVRMIAFQAIDRGSTPRRDSAFCFP